MNSLILGLGNMLLSDEGVGVRIAERLIERRMLPESVEVLDGGTSGMELLETMMGRDLIVICDAVSSTGHKPGDVLRLDGEDLDQFFKQRMSPHQIGLSDVLASLHLLDSAPDKLILFGVVPENLDLGLELSAGVAAARDEVVTLVEREMAAHSASAGNTCGLLQCA